MDTITHALFGLTTYKAIKKDSAPKEMKYALLFTTLVGSEIPDLDVVSQIWDEGGLYLMWHRGITHSLFMVPIWAALLYWLCMLFWKVKDKKIFYIGLLSVFIHVTSDIFNAWGTGYFEPFSTVRLAFGTIPIIDFVVWILILIGFLFSRWLNDRTDFVFKGVGIAIALHFLIQSIQGYVLYDRMDERYDQLALAADFVPWHFKVIGKREDLVEISDSKVWAEPVVIERLKTADERNLDELFLQNPKAKTLYQWAPFVVIVDDERRIGIYDPRFYDDGQSFLFEYLDKSIKKTENRN